MSCEDAPATGRPAVPAAPFTGRPRAGLVGRSGRWPRPAGLECRRRSEAEGCSSPGGGPPVTSTRRTRPVLQATEHLLLRLYGALLSRAPCEATGGLPGAARRSARRRAHRRRGACLRAGERCRGSTPRAARGARRRCRRAGIRTRAPTRAERRLTVAPAAPARVGPPPVSIAEALEALGLQGRRSRGSRRTSTPSPPGPARQPDGRPQRGERVRLLVGDVLAAGTLHPRAASTSAGQRLSGLVLALLRRPQ